jgi:ligand-binding SRPBCC domain-containing protein
MRHSFQTAQWVPYPITQVFAFFADPENLPRLMPGWQRARVEKQTLVAPPDAAPPEAAPPEADCHPMHFTRPVAGIGSAISILFRPFPLSPILMRWDARIVEFEWDDHFCDEQAQGPFAYWRHCHRVFNETQDRIQGTRIVDDLVYELPLGIFSEPAHALIVRRQITAIFRHRQQRLLELL